MLEIKLSVYFDGTFWIGLFERLDCDALSVCKVTFGSEPKDCEVWEFVLKHFYDLKFSAAVQTEYKQVADNPKRRQRAVKKQMKTLKIGTKSQQALCAEREKFKKEKKKVNKLQREAEKQRKFELSQKKRKEKHKGR